MNTRHILLRPKIAEKDLTEAVSRLDTVRSEIQGGKVTFEQAAMLISQDKDSRLNNGVMLNGKTLTNRFEMADLPAEVAKKVDKMNEGDISEPFVMMNAATNRQQVAIVKLMKRIEGHKANITDDYQTLKAIYEQHPDDERNLCLLLDYAGTYAAQAAFVKEGPFDEALDFVHRAYGIAKKNQMTDLMCQTLTSLANIAWAKEDYRQSVDYAHQAESVATDRLRPGTLQVLARSYLDLNMLDSAETVYRQIQPGDDVHLAYIVQSNLAKIALRRMGATKIDR